MVIMCHHSIGIISFGFGFTDSKQSHWDGPVRHKWIVNHRSGINFRIRIQGSSLFKSSDRRLLTADCRLLSAFHCHCCHCTELKAVDIIWITLRYKCLCFPCRKNHLCVILATTKKWEIVHTVPKNIWTKAMNAPCYLLQLLILEFKLLICA